MFSVVACDSSSPLNVLRCLVLIGALGRRLLLIGQEMAYFVSSGGIWNLIISLTAIECMATPHTPRR